MKLSKRLVLASASPRRQRLLSQIGVHPSVVPSHVPEDFNLQLSPVHNALALAFKKAEEVSRLFDDALIVGADTIVILDGVMLGKPVDAADAHRMLRLLSGRRHTVITGFSIVDRPSNEHVSSYESTDVTFRELPDDEIDTYIATGSPIDKAGGYGIQDDYGAVFVTRIEGCFYNVVGFPLSKFYTTLQQFQIHVPERKGHSNVEKD